MTFSDMSIEQRRRVLAWSREHDWGANARWDEPAPGVVILTGCECEVFGPDNARTTERPTFADLADLRDWAGY